MELRRCEDKRRDRYRQIDIFLFRTLLSLVDSLDSDDHVDMLLRQLPSFFRLRVLARALSTQGLQQYGTLEARDVEAFSSMLGRSAIISDSSSLIGFNEWVSRRNCFRIIINVSSAIDPFVCKPQGLDGKIHGTQQACLAP
jgi:hypothetical protein